jgi:hypothetical protein
MILALVMATAYCTFEHTAAGIEAYDSAAADQPGVDAAFISPSQLRSQMDQKLINVLAVKTQVGENWLAAAQAEDDLQLPTMLTWRTQQALVLFSYHCQKIARPAVRGGNMAPMG